MIYKNRVYFNVRKLINYLIIFSGKLMKNSRHIFKSSKPVNILDVTDFSIYYDVETNEVNKFLIV